MQRTLRLMVGVSLLITGCGATGTEPPGETPSGTPTLAIGPDTTLLVDEALTEPVVAHDARGAIIPSPSITWQSSSADVASVDAAGRVVARGPGTATLTATMGSVQARGTITVLPQFTQLATGELHACGITGRGAMYCWGTSFHGEIGPPSASTDCVARFGEGASCSPVPVPSVSLRASAIVAGLMFTCTLDASSHASCWGFNGRGEAGVGSAAIAVQPNAVAGGYQFTQLVAGRSHACGVTTERDAYCWGLDYSGALGAGDVSSERCFDDPCSRTPRLVVGGHKWAQLAATDRATCGVTTTNELYCWGLDVGGSDGLYCQMPDNLVGCTRTPLRTAAPKSYKVIQMGNVHRCAQGMDGLVDCWGANYFGMLGNGTLDQTVTPAVSGGTPYASLAAGRLHNCALTSDGRLQCWGRGLEGESGNGSAQNVLVPTDVAGGKRFAAVTSSGSSDFTCALDDKGRAYCWGWGVFGQIGDGSFESRNVPTLVRMTSNP